MGGELVFSAPSVRPRFYRIGFRVGPAGNPRRQSSVGSSIDGLTILPPFPMRSAQWNCLKRAPGLEILAWPEFVRQDQPFGVLIETHRPNVGVTCAGERGIQPNKPQITFHGPGCRCFAFGQASLVSTRQSRFRAGSAPCESSLRKCARAKGLTVCSVGSSDDVFIAKEKTAFETYLEWYCANRLGNALTFRPNYQWDRTRATTA